MDDHDDDAEGRYEVPLTDELADTPRPLKEFSELDLQAPVVIRCMGADGRVKAEILVRADVDQLAKQLSAVLADISKVANSVSEAVSKTGVPVRPVSWRTWVLSHCLIAVASVFATNYHAEIMGAIWAMFS